MSNERDEHPTVTLDPRTITGPSFAVANATLEQVKPWAPWALRLGVLVLVRDCAHRMMAPEAGAALVDELQGYVDALRHMTWEQR